MDLRTADISEFIDFFEEHVGLKLEFVQFASWKEIKRKVIRDNLIFDYVKRMQQTYQLTAFDVGRLLSTIHLYLTLKKITPQEIHLMTYPHMYIASIDGITFRSGQFIYTPLESRPIEGDDFELIEEAIEGEEESDCEGGGASEPEEIDEDESIE